MSQNGSQLSKTDPSEMEMEPRIKIEAYDDSATESEHYSEDEESKESYPPQAHEDGRGVAALGVHGRPQDASTIKMEQLSNSVNVLTVRRKEKPFVHHARLHHHDEACPRCSAQLRRIGSRSESVKGYFCMCCRRPLPSVAFTKKEARKHDRRRCRACVAAVPSLNENQEEKTTFGILREAFEVNNALTHVKEIAADLRLDMEDGSRVQDATDIVALEAERAAGRDAELNNIDKRSIAMAQGGATVEQGRELFHEWVVIRTHRLALAEQALQLYVALLASKGVPIPQDIMLRVSGQPSRQQSADKCTGCCAPLTTPEATDVSPELCDCCERMVPYTSLGFVRFDDLYSCCETCADGRSMSSGHYEESLEIKPDREWIQCLCDLADTLAFGLPHMTTNPQLAALHQQANKTRTKREALETSQEEALLKGGMSIPQSQQFYVDRVAAERECLEVLTRLNRLIVETMVEVGRGIPRHLNEVITALYASGEAPPNVRQLLDKQQRPHNPDVDPFNTYTDGELVHVQCDGCTAQVAPLPVGGGSYCHFCDCCLRVFSYKYGNTTCRETDIAVCDTCNKEGDPAVVAAVLSQPRKRPKSHELHQMFGYVGTLQAGVRPQDLDPKRTTADAQVTAYKQKRKQLQATFTTVSAKGPVVPIAVSRQLYEEYNEIENGLMTAMITLARMLLEEAAERKMTFQKHWKDIAAFVYQGVQTPEAVTAAVLMDPMKAAALAARVPCETCTAVLDPPLPGKGRPAFCDCCKRMLPTPMIADTQRNGSGGVSSICNACQTQSAESVPRTGDQFQKKRLDSNWLQSTTGSLRAMMKAAFAKASTSSNSVSDTRLLTAEQGLEECVQRYKVLSTRQKTTLKAKTLTPYKLSRELYTVDVTMTEGWLEALKELVQIELDIMRERQVEIPTKLKAAVDKIRRAGDEPPIQVTSQAQQSDSQQASRGDLKRSRDRSQDRDSRYAHVRGGGRHGQRGSHYEQSRSSGRGQDDRYAHPSSSGWGQDIRYTQPSSRDWARQDDRCQYDRGRHGREQSYEGSQSHGDFDHDRFSKRSRFDNGREPR